MRRMIATGALALTLGSGPSAAEMLDPAGYAGSDRCAECHKEKYDGWKETFHATVVKDAKKDPSAILGDFTAPGLPFTRDEVEYTIGGHWDQRYMKKIDDDYYVLPKLWSVPSRTWQPYNVWGWRKMPYSKYCRGCHVTAYEPDTGTETEHRIGCESCHGPGKAHAEAGGEAAIVQPAKLPEDRRKMICAACHVRGKDPSGTYHFPVAFTPGEDLGHHYVPNDVQPGETNSQAILRAYDKWQEDRKAGKSKCDVCGIPGAPETKKNENAAALDFCFGCHEFKEKYPEHTRHPAGTDLACFDCHVQKTKDIMNVSDEQDIHSYGYFLVHVQQCYDPEIEKYCGKCHEGRDLEWSRRLVEQWRAPGRIDH
ncbi:MAG: multiheme c-type cytochrome [Thermodesulfobacteriota bacterium]